MKKTALLIAALLCLGHAPVRAQSAGNCAQLMSQAEALVAAMDRDAREYWNYRANYVGFTFDGRGAKNPNAAKLAEQAKSLAAPIQARSPLAYSNLRALLENMKQQSCSTPAKLAALREAAFRSSQKVRIDRFPEEEREEKPELAQKTVLPNSRKR